jgi:hypothetical protein
MIVLRILDVGCYRPLLEKHPAADGLIVVMLRAVIVVVGLISSLLED